MIGSQTEMRKGRTERSCHRPPKRVLDGPWEDTPMRKIGSQTRETLEESGYRLLDRWDEDTIVLQSIEDPDQQEVWFKHDDHAGYTIEVDGVGYEYARDLLSLQKYPTA